MLAKSTSRRKRMGLGKDIVQTPKQNKGGGI